MKQRTSLDEREQYQSHKDNPGDSEHASTGSEQTTQLIKSFLHDDKTDISIFLWLDGWSNWITTLTSMGFTSLYLVNDNLVHLSPILKKAFAVKEINSTELVEVLHSARDQSVMLILEGPPMKVRSWYESIREFMDVDSLFAVCLVFSSRLRKYFKSKKLTWKRISHANDTGGATTNTVQIAFWSHKAWNEIPKPPSWNLKDLVDVTQTGVVAPLAQQTRTLLLDVSKWNDHMVLPSVFSSTGWVSRKLMLSELLRCLDIPRQFDEQIRMHYGNELVDKSDFNEVITAPAGKIIWFLVQALLSTDSEGSSNKLRSKSALALPLYNSIIRGDFNPVSVQESSIDKSVKADDAEVPVSLWNKNYLEIKNCVHLISMTDCWNA